jgi:hypothetical protein
MSDTFTFVAPVMSRRRLDPFAARLVALGLALAVVVAALGTFVVRAERTADARRAVLQAQQEARDVAEAQRLAAEAQAGLAHRETAMTTVPAGVGGGGGGGGGGGPRAPPPHAAERALALAEGELGRTGDLSAAGVTELTQRDGGLLFVDGPSTAPTIVSIAGTARSWGAAVMGPSGTCYWISLGAGGDVRYDQGSTCTGQAALAAARPAW